MVICQIVLRISLENKLKEVTLYSALHIKEACHMRQNFQAVLKSLIFGVENICLSAVLFKN